MLEGLNAMGAAELAEVAALVGIDEKTRAGLNEAQIRERALKWLGKAVQAPNPQPETVERAVLEWVANTWALPFDPAISTDDLERSVRIKIATDAAEYLAPTWELACALIALGPMEAIGPKLDLLERSASLVVPSRSARQQLVATWGFQCKMWNGKNPIEEIKPALEALKGKSGRAEQALTLALVLSLADGRLSYEEENLFKAMANEFEIDHAEMIRRVNGLFWGHQVQVDPKSQGDAESEKATALKAALMTLSSSGTLEGLILQARDTVKQETLASKHAPKSGWQKVLGTLSGLGQYLSSRLRTEDQVNLVRIVYLAILRQHAHAAAHQPAAAPTPAAPPPPPQPAQPASIPSLEAAQAEPPKRRTISLD